MSSVSDDVTNKIKEVVGSDFYNAVNVASDIFGKLNSGYQIFQAGMGFAKTLGILDSGPDPVMSKLQELQSKLQDIQRTLEGIHNELVGIREDIANAQSGLQKSDMYKDTSLLRTAADDAYGYMRYGAGDQTGDLWSVFDAHLNKAEENINYFLDDPFYWRRFYLDFLDYSDVWSGYMHPPTEGVDWVFDYMFSMSLYLEALSNWCIVILASKVDFQKTQLNDEKIGIKRHIDKLHERLTMILSGFQLIRAPDIDELVYAIMETDDNNFLHHGSDPEDPIQYYDVQSDGPVQMTESEINEVLKYIPGGKWRLSGYLNGVVEIYTGLTCLSAYPISEVVEGANYLDMEKVSNLFIIGISMSDSQMIIQPEGFQKFYDRFVLRHSLRSWKQAKVLSQSLSLSNISKSIRHLCDMRNQQPPELPLYNRYVVSSLREIRSIVSDSMRDAQNQGKPFGMRELGGMLGIQSPITLRRIFFLDE